MRTLMITLLIGSLSLTASAQQADDKAWFPMAVGNSWTYDVEVSATVPGVGSAVVKRGSASLRVTGTREVGGLTCYVVKFKGLDSSDTLVVHEANGELKIVSATSATLILLPGNLGARKPAAATVHAGGAAVKLSDHTVGQPQALKTPAGEYQAVPVRATVDVGGGVKARTAVWYAAGVGPVKMEMTGKTAGNVAGKRVLVLKRASRGAAPVKPVEPVKPVKPIKPIKPVEPAKLVEPGTAKQAAGAGGALDRLIASAVKAGADSDAAKQLAARAAAVVARAKALAEVGPGPGAGLPITVSADDVSAAARTSGKLIITSGDLSGPSFEGCVLIVSGDITVTGMIKNCVVLCSGDVSVAGYLKDSTVAIAGDVSVAGYLKESVVEVDGDLAISGYSKQTVYINTQPAVGRQKGDRRVTDERGLRAVAEGR